jgi:hypothetical protein
LAALLALAFARPEINRELEQISTLKGTEILRENTGWTEEKFLEELRKALPAGVSRELNYEDTWNEVAKTYQFIKNGKYSENDGMRILMNSRSQIMINGEFSGGFSSYTDLPRQMEKNLSQKGKAVSPIIIDDNEVQKIIRFTMIRLDVNTPPDDYQKLLNAVGEAYISKRNEMARKYFQTGYNALETEQKSVIDDVAPMLVKIEIPRGSSTTVYVDKEEIDNHEIILNGKSIKFKDLGSEFPEQFKNDFNQSRYNSVGRYTQWSDKGQDMLFAFELFSEKSFILNGQWVNSIYVDWMIITNISSYVGDEAVKLYGNKAKDGVISISTL